MRATARSVQAMSAEELEQLHLQLLRSSPFSPIRLLRSQRDSHRQVRRARSAARLGGRCGQRRFPDADSGACPDLNEGDLRL